MVLLRNFEIDTENKQLIKSFIDFHAEVFSELNVLGMNNVSSDLIDHFNSNIIQFFELLPFILHRTTDYMIEPIVVILNISFLLFKSPK